MGLLLKLLGKPINRIWLGCSLILIFVALAGGRLTGYDPLEVNTENRFIEPGTLHWMGTDNLGRDVSSRTLSGTRLALQSCLIILVSATTFGTLIGVIAGYYGGITDEVFMRISDIFIAFPGLVLALAIAAALGPNLNNAMVAISVVWWPPYARLVRGQVLALKQREYIESSRSLGGGSSWIIMRHILPNIMVPLLIQTTSDIGPALVTTSSLSFIGLGAQPPAAEWGSMVSLGRKYLLDYWWMSTFPGAAIFLTVWVFNGIGEAVRGVLSTWRNLM
jgi:peptide/nickel transport system permease protein